MKCDVVARDVHGTAIGRWHFRFRWTARRWIRRQLALRPFPRRPAMWTYHIEDS